MLTKELIEELKDKENGYGVKIDDIEELFDVDRRAFGIWAKRRDDVEKISRKYFRFTDTKKKKKK